MLNDVEQIASGNVHNYLFKRYTPLRFEALILFFVPSVSFHDVLYFGHMLSERIMNTKNDAPNGVRFSRTCSEQSAVGWMRWLGAFFLLLPTRHSTRVSQGL